MNNFVNITIIKTHFRLKTQFLVHFLKSMSDVYKSLKKEI